MTFDFSLSYINMWREGKLYIKKFLKATDNMIEDLVKSGIEKSYIPNKKKYYIFFATFQKIG